MLKNKIALLALSSLLFGSCSSITPIVDSLSDVFSSTKNTPLGIQEAVASRVNPETELYALSSAPLSKIGSIVAQSQANKEGVSLLKNQIKKEVEAIYKTHLNNMDAFSRSVVSPVIPELSNYATDLILKKATQKGAWEDGSKIYSLLSVEKNIVRDITDKVLKKFTNTAAKKLSEFGNIQ